MSRRAVFLDRDGTLNVERDFVRAPAELELLPGVVPALHRLRAAGFRLVVVTNQSGVARGYFDEAALARIHERLHALLDGLPLAYLHCPHHPSAGGGGYTRACVCRKPSPGLIDRAAALFDLDLGGSWVIGDSARDVLLARARGMRSVLVHSGKPVEDARRDLARAGYRPDHECPDLPAAVERILG
jgi:D-glycero-D-manno-heptose 1,7-bisphosphate phosphatase